MSDIVPELSNLNSDELAKIWRRQFSGKLPDHLPKSVLRHLLAYKLQVERYGDLSIKAQNYLRQIEVSMLAGAAIETPYPDDKQLKPGSELVREHDGVHHRVMVMQGGFAWNGRAFASLSAVAKAITGTNWNGPRFFGLKQSAAA